MSAVTNRTSFKLEATENHDIDARHPDRDKSELLSTSWKCQACFFSSLITFI